MRAGFLTCKRKTLLFLFSILFLSGIGKGSLAAQCSLACNNLLNVALDADCQEEITEWLILQSDPTNCDPPDFAVTVYQPNGLNPIPTSPVITSAEIGQVLPVEVSHPATGQSCWGSIQVSDNLPPQMTCPAPDTVLCSAPLTPFDVGAPAISDCQGYTQSYYDQFTDLGCSDPTGYILRTWTAVDSDGNFNTCEQTIYLAAVDLAAVVFPADRNGQAAPVVDCASPITDPSVTGEPQLDGLPIPEGGVCELTVYYSDLQVPGCNANGTTYAILRTWSVLEWCSGNVEQHTQVILVDDNTPPEMTLPDTLFAYTNQPLVCLSEVAFPAALLSDNCSDSIGVQILTPFGSIPANGGVLGDIPVGQHTVTYQATDACGNVTTRQVILVVTDNMPPVAICDQITSVSLGPFGTTLVFAETFDDGSFDNCCPVELAIRRTDGQCEQAPDFSSQVTFCCTDIGTTVDVELRVQDCFGNANFCDVLVLVNDQVAPEITCPSAVTISCDANPLDPQLTGTPQVFDGCGVDSLGFTDLEELNDCMVGTINRTWTVFDSLGNQASCVQLITLDDQTPLTITFPPDLELTGCYEVDDLDPDDLPTPYDYPVVANDDCELVATNVSDEVFTITADACLKIIRTWTLIDWCVYEPNNSDSPGIYVGVQTIKVIDEDAPLLSCPANQFVEITESDCLTTVNLPPPMIDDCDPVVAVDIVTDLGVGNGPFVDVSPGNYTATYFATDGCNNTANCSISIAVADAKAPTPYCMSGAVITLMPVDTTGDGEPDSGLIELGADELDLGSFDNCDSQIQYTFSADPADTVRAFSCTDLGFNALEIWVSDQSGNQDFCETAIIIQDNIGLCNGGTLPGVAGIITDELGQPIEQVAVTISDTGQATQWTAADGLYEFSELVAGLDYSITPSRDTAVRNGITTWDLVYITKHILGVAPLDSPYKIIAADADGSGTVSTLDVVALQQLILYVSDDLPNGTTSWRFVPTDYVFSNTSDPLAESFPEVLNINDLEGDIVAADFMGIKVGDVNNSALPGALAGPSNRSMTSRIRIMSDRYEVEAGEEFHWPLYVEDEDWLQAFQGSFSFDPGKIQIREMEAPQCSEWSHLNFALPPARPGQATFSWYNPEGTRVSNEKPILILHGVTYVPGRLEDLISAGTLLSPEWIGTGAFSQEWEWDVASRVPALSVYPTLVQEVFTICTDEKGIPMSIDIFDQTGRWHRSVEVLECRTFSADFLPGKGVYFVRDSRGGTVARLIRLK